MFGKKFLTVLAVTLLLVTLASPVMAESSDSHWAGPVQTTTWSGPVYGLPVVVPGHFHLMCGGCSTGGNCSC